MSIVVPVYNVEKYLRECLDSLVNQTLKEIEIIVVNDCSPDNSEAIILEYAAKDDRIVYIKHEVNKCLGGARNTGIRAARGKYITFVDSDDYVDKNLYKAALNAFEEYNVDLISIPFQVFDENGFGNSYYIPCKKIYQIDDLSGILTSTYYAAWSKLYYLSDIKKYNLEFPENIYWEDVPFWAEYCALISPKVFNLPNKYGHYQYRQRSESISGRNSQTYSQIPQMFLYLYQQFLSRGLANCYFENMYQIILNESVTAWKILDEKHKLEFIHNFIFFIKKIPFDIVNLKISPICHILTSTDDFSIQKTIFQLYIDYVDLERRYLNLEKKMKDNYWYNFGLLSSKQKIRSLFCLFLKRLFKPLLLRSKRGNIFL